MSLDFANITLAGSLLITVLAYVKLSRLEGSYVNIMLPALVISIPANYLFPYIYAYLFGIEASRYAFAYVYATLAVENVAFVYAYWRTRGRVFRLPVRFGYRNFGRLAWICIGLAVLLYVPLLLQFRESLLHPREIYAQTRTGFGVQFYISGTLSYLAIIFILFAKRSWVTKTVIVTAAMGILALHGSKGLVMYAVFLLILFQIYGKGKKVALVPTLLACLGMGVFVLALFATTMSLGEGAGEALEAISEYSDYTRNAMMVIDEHFPPQYGRLTMEAGTIALIPRVLMPSKPKNFGPMRLDEEFYPESMDLDQGAPSFGLGVQYADFGVLAIVYLALCGLFKGWLARMFVNRLKATQHPADFFMVAFLADLQLFPVGGAGWLLPEALLVAVALRFLSRVGAKSVYQEAQRTSSPLSSAISPPGASPGLAT